MNPRTLSDKEAGYLLEVMLAFDCHKIEGGSEKIPQRTKLEIWKLCHHPHRLTFVEIGRRHAMKSTATARVYHSLNRKIMRALRLRPFLTNEWMELENKKQQSLLRFNRFDPSI